MSAASHALYRFYGDAGTLLYVGITDNPSRRFGQHAKGKEWWPLVRGIAIDWYGTRQAVEAAERRAVAVEQPAYNKALRRRVVAVPPALPVLPWERADLTDVEREAVEVFECRWTARWWDDETARAATASRYQHDGRLYAWRPDDWPTRIIDLCEVDDDLVAAAIGRAFSRNGPDGVWADFFNMCVLDELV